MACSCCFLHWAWSITVPSWNLESIQGLLHTSTQLTPTPGLHILTVTQICTPWWTHTHTRTYICTQICIHWHRPTLNWTHIITALSFSLSCSTMILECTLALLSFTFCLHWTEYTQKSQKKEEDMKLKHTPKSWSWLYLTSYQIGPIINQFLYLHYSILSILCICSLSPSLCTIFSSSTNALHKHEKGSCSAISAIQSSWDQGFNQKTSGL